MRIRLLAILIATCSTMPLSAQGVPAGPAPGPSGMHEPISAAEARATAADFARLLEANYLYPDVAKRYAETIRRNAADGNYDRMGTRGALAAAMTRDVQSVHSDGHLKIFPKAAAAGSPQQPMMMAPAPSQAGAAAPATPGPGKPIEEARWLAPGIAYIRFTVFPPGDPSVVAAAAKFMADHADAKTIIFDVRTHMGGTGAPTAAMAPFLFEKEAVFYRQDMRASVAQAMGGGPSLPPWMRSVPAAREGVVSRDNFVTPHARERRLFDAKVFVLTSGFTASAAEGLAFGLKTNGRATLIGETTAGAGNFAPGGQRVNDKFAAIVPVGRSYDPRSGKGWEGVGVAPDIPVPAERALVEALVRSGIAKDEAERLSASVHPKGPMKKQKLAS